MCHRTRYNAELKRNKRNLAELFNSERGYQKKTAETLSFSFSLSVHKNAFIRARGLQGYSQLPLVAVPSAAKL